MSILSSRSRDSKEYRLLSFSAEYCGRSLQTFRSSILPPAPWYAKQVANRKELHQISFICFAFSSFIKGFAYFAVSFSLTTCLDYSFPEGGRHMYLRKVDELVTSQKIIF